LHCFVNCFAFFLPFIGEYTDACCCICDSELSVCVYLMKMFQSSAVRWQTTRHQSATESCSAAASAPTRAVSWHGWLLAAANWPSAPKIRPSTTASQYVKKTPHSLSRVQLRPRRDCDSTATSAGFPCIDRSRTGVARKLHGVIHKGRPLPPWLPLPCPLLSALDYNPSPSVRTSFMDDSYSCNHCNRGIRTLHQDTCRSVCANEHDPEYVIIRLHVEPHVITIFLRRCSTDEDFNVASCVAPQTWYLRDIQNWRVLTWPLFLFNHFREFS